MKANCKINLKLKIVGLREDNYHLLDMVMQEINLYDDLIIKLIPHKVNKNSNTNKNNISTNFIFDNVTNKSPIKKAMTDSNIIIKTAKLMCSKYNINFNDFNITLNKNIPISAGLGGGSTDSAQTIKQINALCNLNLSKEEMIDIAVKLGADVPFFIEGGIKRCEGIGEILSNNIDTTLPNNSYLLILTPNVFVPTKDIFNEYDEMKKNNNFTKLNYKSMYENDLSFVAIKKFPIIENFIILIKSLGAIDSQMSGSGPTVFGIFDSIEKAEYVKKNILSNNNYNKLIRYINVHRAIL